MRIQRAVAAIAGALVCLLPASARAQDARPAQTAPAQPGDAAKPQDARPAQTAPAQPGDAAKPQDLSKWWEKSSLAFDPVPNQLLFHLAIDFSFTDSRGNTDGTMLTKRGELTLRKRRLTDRLTTDIQDTNMVYGLGGGASDYHQSTTRNLVEFDLTKAMLLVGGVEYARNTLFFLDKRLTFFGGAGATLLDADGQRFSLTGGVGYTSFRFMEEEIAQINPAAVTGLPTFTPDSGGAMLSEAWTWTMSKKVSIQQTGSVMEYFDQGLGHLVNFDVSVNVPVAKYLSFVPRYTVKDEDNIYVRALGVKTLDRTFSIGIRVAL